MTYDLILHTNNLCLHIYDNIIIWPHTQEPLIDLMVIGMHGND